MGAEQAASVLVTVKNDQLAREGQPPLSAEVEAAMKDPVIQMIEGESNPWHSTANLWDDGIVDPAKTRDLLGLAISASLNQPLPERAPWGVFRM